MATTEPLDQFIELDTDVRLHIRHWRGERSPFVLVHGLASNCRLWESVAHQLAARGHQVVTVDQRGHGLSDKPTTGYDFATVAADLAALVDQLDLSHPVIGGQSWGGNVLLEFGARYPGRARGLAFIDGGFLDLQMYAPGDWATTAERLRPPDLRGKLMVDVRRRIEEAHAVWESEQIEAVLANFSLLPDGTVRPWLALENHMQILRALWEQRPRALYPRVQEPVLICAALGTDPQGNLLKREQVAAAEATLRAAAVHWFEDTHHDIHLHRPTELATLLSATLTTGIWSRNGL